MDKNEDWSRKQTVERYPRGEKFKAICTSEGRTGRWLYKRLERFRADAV